MTITQKWRRVMTCFGLALCALNAKAKPEYHLGQHEPLPTFCQKVTADACASFSVFEQVVRDSCLNVPSYRTSCLHAFCKSHCAQVPCPTGRTGQLCKVYCHDIQLPDMGDYRLLNACLMKKGGVHPQSAFHQHHIQKAHRDIKKLEKILRARDVLFHVDGLHLGSHSIVRPADFRGNVKKAIQFTKVAHDLLKGLQNHYTVTDLQKSARYKVAASDEHVQYFAVVTSDLNKASMKIRPAILKRQISDLEVTAKQQAIQPHPTFDDLVSLLQEREALLYIDPVKDQNGGIVRLHEFMPHVKQILPLTYIINHTYQYLKNHYHLTKSHHEIVKKADQHVLDFVDQVYALNQDCHRLIRSIASGTTYRTETYPHS